MFCAGRRQCHRNKDLERAHVESRFGLLFPRDVNRRRFCGEYALQRLQGWCIALSGKDFHMQRRDAEPVAQGLQRGSAPIRAKRATSRFAAIVACAATLGAGLALADERERERERECLARAAAVIDATGAEFDRMSPAGLTIFLRHWSIHQTMVSCTKVLIAVVLREPLPSEAMLDYVDRAAQGAYAAKEGEMRRATQSCYRAALKDSGSHAVVSTPRLSVSCEVVTGVAPTIFLAFEPKRR